MNVHEEFNYNDIKSSFISVYNDTEKLYQSIFIYLFFFSTKGKATLCSRGDSYECQTLDIHQSCVSNAGCDVTASNALRKNACDQAGCCLQCFKSCIKCSKCTFVVATKGGSRDAAHATISLRWSVN